MSTETREAIGALVKTSYFLGLASGSGQEVFENGQIHSFDDLKAQYRERDAEVSRLLTLAEQQAGTDGAAMARGDG